MCVFGTVLRIGLGALYICIAFIAFYWQSGFRSKFGEIFKLCLGNIWIMQLYTRYGNYAMEMRSRSISVNGKRMHWNAIQLLWDNIVVRYEKRTEWI